MTYQPELKWWSHVWRYALVLGISVAAWSQLADWQWDNRKLWFWSDFALGVVALCLLPLRRRYPVTVAVITNSLTAVSASAGGPGALALVSLATHRRWRHIIPVGLLTFVAGMVFMFLDPVSEEPWTFTVPFLLSFLAVTVGWGMYIGSRRELLATLRDRAETAEAEQASRVTQARTAERSRIAREMHDVLAHRISLVTMHAGALTYRRDLSADQMRATAEIIQDNAHEAMVELREVLGILRDGPGDAAPELPQPSAIDLPHLLAEARRSGMRIEDSQNIELELIPETLGRTAYRVIQEGLTNARKHAADTLVTVELNGSPDAGLTVVVRNPLRIGSTHAQAPESGLGLVGLSERSVLAGGHLTHHISARQDFVLQAWLPWPT